MTTPPAPGTVPASSTFICLKRPPNITIDVTPASRCSAVAGHRARWVARMAALGNFE